MSIFTPNHSSKVPSGGVQQNDPRPCPRFSGAYSRSDTDSTSPKHVSNTLPCLSSLPFYDRRHRIGSLFRSHDSGSRRCRNVLTKRSQHDSSSSFGAVSYQQRFDMREDPPCYQPPVGPVFHFTPEQEVRIPAKRSPLPVLQRNLLDHLRLPVENRELVHYNNFDIAKALGSTKYIECIPLTLKEVFYGKHLVLHFTRKHRSGETSRDMLSMVVLPGSSTELVYSFPAVGHQLSTGEYQDVNFIVMPQSVPTDHKQRGDDVYIQASLPWTDRLLVEPCVFQILGIDGATHFVEVDYKFSQMARGVVTFKSSGRVKADGHGRGNLTVEWELVG